MKFILEFAFIQGRKLSWNRFDVACGTVGLTTTSGDAIGAGGGIMTARILYLINALAFFLHFVSCTISLYIQLIRDIFDRDIVRAYSIYTSEIIICILVI